MDNFKQVQFIVTTLFKRLVEDGKRLNPEDPGAYSLSVLAACFAESMKIVIDKCNEQEINNLKKMFEDMIAISEIMASESKEKQMDECIFLIVGVIIGWFSCILFKKNKTQDVEDQWNYKQ